MKKSIFALMIILPSLLVGQSYNSAGGITYYKYLGLTFVQRVANHTTVEGRIARAYSTTRDKDFTGSIIGNQHFPLITKRLNFVVGAGPQFTKYERFDNTSLGLHALAGLDLTIRKLNISWDMGFRFDKHRKFSFLEPETTLSIRYVFIKRPTKASQWFKDKKYQFWKKKKNKRKTKRDSKQ